MIGRLLGVVGLAVGWALVAAVGVAVWLHLYPSRGDVTIYLTSVVPFAVIAAVGAVLIFAVLRRWIMLTLAIVAALAFGYTQAPLVLAQEAPAGESFTVVSANLLFGEADIDALVALVADADADLLSLQEVTPEAAAAIDASPLAAQLPHEFTVPYVYAAGTALRSRLPLTDHAQIEGTVLKNLSARTDLPGAVNTQVLALHPAAPLRGTTGTWLDDMEVLRQYFAELPPGRVIAAGDFNATWDQRRYRDLLIDGLVDTADQAGSGFLPTYPTDRTGNRPLVAIDHVIVRGFVATSVTTHELPGSDHRAVVVSLVAS